MLARYCSVGLFTLILACVAAAQTSLPTDPRTSTEIQAVLDATGYVKLKPGTYVLDKPLVVLSNKRLEGSGKSTVLQPSNVTNPGPYLIKFGPDSGNLYGAYVSDLCLYRGGMEFRQVAQHCGVDKVWCASAPEHAFYFGLSCFGEGMVLRDCVAWEATQAGFCVNSKQAFVNLTFDHCNAQNCRRFGVYIVAAAPNGDITNTLFNNCVIQGNGTVENNVQTGADVYMAGFVTNTLFQHTHIETTKAAYGVYLEVNRETNSGVGLVEFRDRCTFAPFGTASPLHADRTRVAVSIDRATFNSTVKAITYSGPKPILTSTNFPAALVQSRYSPSPVGAN